MGQRLAEKTCVVTGAAQGIGLAIARAFASEGAHVVAGDLQFCGADSERRADSIERRQLDAANCASVEAFAGSLSRVDVLVNCVGRVAHGAILECPPEEFETSMRVNVGSAYLMTRALLPVMLNRQRGSIINIASVVGIAKSPPDRLAYATSKAALIGLTKAIARDYITRGIRCNAISPGTVRTPSLEQRIAQQGDGAAVAFVSRQPMARLGEPEEVAHVAVLLASDEAAFMSGSEIIIDGGMSL